MITDEMLSILKDIKERLEAMESIAKAGRIVMRTQEEIDLSLAKKICIEQSMALKCENRVEVELDDYDNGTKKCLLVVSYDNSIASRVFIGDYGNLRGNLDQRVLASIRMRYEDEGGETPITLCIQYGQT